MGDVVIFARLFSQPSAFIAVIAVIADHVLFAVGDVGGQLSQPVQSRKHLTFPSVFGLINDLGPAIGCDRGRDVLHPFLGKCRPDNVPGQVLDAGIVARPDGRAAVNIEAAVVLAHHILYNPVRQAVGLEQLEHLLPEQGFQVGWFGPVGRHELSISIEAAVRGDDVKMRIEILKVAERMYRHHAAGHGIVIRNGVFQIMAQDFPGAF